MFIQVCVNRDKQSFIPSHDLIEKISSHKINNVENIEYTLENKDQISNYMRLKIETKTKIFCNN